MERKPEQKAWDRIRNGMARYRGVVRLERFENLVAEGPGDVLAIHKTGTRGGIVTWLELKAAPEIPKLGSTRLMRPGKGLRLSQRNWALDWRNHYGRYAIIIDIGDGAEFALIGGHFADEVNDWPLATVRRSAIACEKDITRFCERLKYYLGDYE